MPQSIVRMRHLLLACMERACQSTEERGDSKIARSTCTLTMQLIPDRQPDRLKMRALQRRCVFLSLAVITIHPAFPCSPRDLVPSLGRCGHFDVARATFLLVLEILRDFFFAAYTTMKSFVKQTCTILHSVSSILEARWV